MARLDEAKLHSHIEFQDMDISVEVPAGGARRGVNKKTGQAWEHKIDDNYGYIKGTHSPDGEHLDCYVRKNPNKNAKVYVMHQLSVDGSKFDEDKVMLGYDTAAQARAAFKKYTFKPETMYGGMTEFTLEHFRVIAYQASNSKAMLTDEATFEEFKKKGLMPQGIKSPLTIARRVSESINEGLRTIGEHLCANNVETCLREAGWEPGCMILDADELVSDAYLYFMESGLQELDYLDDDEFKSRAFDILVQEHASIDEDFEVEEDFQNVEAARVAQKWHTMNARHLRDKLKHETDSKLRQKYKDDADIHARKATDATKWINTNAGLRFEDEEVTEDQEELIMAEHEEKDTVQESYSVILHMQVMENIGTETIPQWATSSPRARLIQSGIEGYAAARQIAEQVESGEIPVEFASREFALGVEIIPDSEYRQFHEAVETEEQVEETTTEDVFFAQQIQEVSKLAGIKTGSVEYTGTPSVHQTLETLAKLSEGEQLDEYAMRGKKEMERAKRVLDASLIKNPNVKAIRVVKAVANKLFDDENQTDEIVSYIENISGMDLDEYAEEIRTQG